MAMMLNNSQMKTTECLNCNKNARNLGGLFCKDCVRYASQYQLDQCISCNKLTVSAEHGNSAICHGCQYNFNTLKCTNCNTNDQIHGSLWCQSCSQRAFEFHRDICTKCKKAKILVQTPNPSFCYDCYSTFW